MMKIQIFFPYFSLSNQHLWIEWTINEISIKHKHKYMYIICVIGSMYLLLFNFLWKEKFCYFNNGNEKKNVWGDSNPVPKDELIYKPNIIHIAYEVLVVSYVHGRGQNQDSLGLIL